jgi:ribosomal protein L6P/L9E
MRGEVIVNAAKRHRTCVVYSCIHRVTSIAVNGGVPLTDGVLGTLTCTLSDKQILRLHRARVCRWKSGGFSSATHSTSSATLANVFACVDSGFEFSEIGV